MSIKRKVLAVAAMVTMVGGVSTVGTLAASAATPQCGPHCIQIFSAKSGTNANPNFVETVFQGVGTVGQPTMLARPSSSNPVGTSSPRLPVRAWCLTSSPPGWCPPR